MKKKELEQFINKVEDQFKKNKQIIIDGYQQYLKDVEDPYKTICIESFGVAMIGEYNTVVDKLPFKLLYNFIESYRNYMIDRHPETFRQKPECYVEFYTDNFLIQMEGLGYKKMEKSLNY
jgi:hypothetical protein